MKFMIKRVVMDGFRRILTTYYVEGGKSCHSCRPLSFLCDVDLIALWLLVRESKLRDASRSPTNGHTSHMYICRNLTSFVYMFPYQNIGACMTIWSIKGYSVIIHSWVMTITTCMCIILNDNGQSIIFIGILGGYTFDCIMHVCNEAKTNEDSNYN